MRSIGRVVTGALLLASAGCATAPGNDDASAPDGPRHIHATHEHPGERDAEADTHDGDHSGREHHSGRQLAAALLRVSDLPVGYTAGAGHHHPAENGSAPDVPEECAAIAHLIGTHPAVVAQHPQADISFAKSHFGPEVTERIIDYGDTEDARDALDAITDVASTCRVYEQQASGQGVNRYRVSQSGPVDGSTGGATVHLEAIGGDFEGIHWDIWVSESEGQLVAVSLRSARGGSSVDLAPAVDAARARL